jgi:AraC family transcriptional regulator
MEMAGLFDALPVDRATIMATPTRRIRRVRYGDASIVVDSADELSLVLNLSEAHRAIRRSNGRSLEAQPRVGAVTVIPPGCPTTFVLNGTATVLMFRLSWAELRGWYTEEHGLDPDRLEFEPRLAFADHILARLLCCTAVCDATAEEEMLRSIAERLFTAHRARPSGADPRSAGGLSPARLRRVLQRIESAPDEPTMVSTLATEAGMSTFHFAREFHRATGSPPHRYMLQRRIARAIALLADRRLAIADVAVGAGFSHASHLAKHMRRMTGLSPSAFRTNILL